MDRPYHFPIPRESVGAQDGPRWLRKEHWRRIMLDKISKVFQLLMFTQEQLRAAYEVWKTFKDCMQRKNDQRCCLIWWWFAFLKGKRKMIKPWNWFKKFFSGMENFTFDRFGEFIVNSICNSHAIIYYISSHERSRTVFSAKKLYKL